VAKRASQSESVLRGREILVGVSGGIAAYKTAYLVSRLVQEGAGVNVIMTEHAARFVAPLTFQTLSGRPAYTDLFIAPEAHQARHVALADLVDMAVVAPATADIIGKLAHGIADDLLSTSLLALDVPVILAPAMNERMWDHPAVRANIETLRARGVRMVGPQEGRLACGKAGTGRMAEPDAILAQIVNVLTNRPRKNAP